MKLTTHAATPPHSTEVEQTVLGALLIDGSAFVDVAEVVSTDDFYDPAHREIYEAMQGLSDRRQPIDVVTLTSALEDSERINNAGGSAYIVELCTRVPTSANVVPYAGILRKKSISRKIIKAGSDIAKVGFDEKATVEEQLDKVERFATGVTPRFLRKSFTHIKDILAGRYDKFAEAHAAVGDDLEGVPTGLRALDQRLSGLQASDLIVIAARPGMGKTSLALTFAENAALKYGKHIGIFSLEMSKEQLVDRLFASKLSVDSWKMRRGKLDDDDFRRMGPIMDELYKANIYIDDSVSSTLAELRAKSRRLHKDGNLDLLIVDYLQLMSAGTSAYAGNRVQEISEVSRTLKEIARELHIPVVAMSQLSRAVENRPGNIPQLSDLRESGSIEQDADIVLMLYREDFYEEDSDRPGITDVYIRKFRNGPTGRAEVRFLKDQTRFVDTAKEASQAARVGE